MPSGPRGFDVQLRVDRDPPMTPHTVPDDRESRVRELQELRAATVRRIADLEQSFDGIVEATSDVATDDEHDPEGHTIAWERQQIAALLAEARTTLTDIDAALQRLDDGSYGICAVCGRQIAPERLDALPAVSICVSCAR
jgi:DnaK suppressor protein